MKTFREILTVLAAAAALYLALWISPDLSRADDWTKGDVALEVAWGVAHIVDWGTTRDLSKRYDEGLYETNFILGRHPSTSKVDLYMGACMVLHPMVTDLLPKHATTLGIDWNPRAAWQYVTIGVSAGAAGSNLSLGLHIDF